MIRELQDYLVATLAAKLYELDHVETAEHAVMLARQFLAEARRQRKVNG